MADTLERAARDAALPSWRGAALEARGLVDGDVDSLRGAVEAYRRSPRDLAGAGAAESAARALLADGEIDEARPLLEQALAALVRAGAVRDHARVAALIRSTGGRVARSPHKAGHDRSRLSPAETEVTRLVAEGLTNAEVAARLYVSRRTVETHLYRIFGKLGIRSRVELALLATDDARMHDHPTPRAVAPDLTRP